jgi:hypothetical protein
VDKTSTAAQADSRRAPGGASGSVLGIGDSGSDVRRRVRRTHGQFQLRIDRGYRLPLANDAESIHNPLMSLKNAALLALIGTILLTVLIAASFISTLLGVMRGVIVPMTLLTSLVQLFTSVTVLVFFYVFHRTQP